MDSKKLQKFLFRQLADILIALVLSGFITYAFAGNKLFTNFSTTYKNLLFGFFIGFSLWKVNQFVSFIGDYFFPWKINPVKTLIVDTILSITFTVVDIIAVHYLYLLIVFDINFFDNPQRWIWQMVITFLISLLITISFYLAYFFKWWRIATINEEKLKQEAIQLRYDALKSQVNPHFLFNSLSVLSSLVDANPQKAKEFIQQFSNIYRYVLEQREQELVPLEDELNFIKSYVTLHQIRHGENLHISIDINNKTGYVIPLSIQILLENCFKHNIISEEMPLKVKVWRENDYIVVQNNLQKRKSINDSGGVGLDTISKRYEYFTKEPLKIEVTSESYLVMFPVLNILK